MDSNTLILIIELMAGILINIFIGKLARGIFKKDGTGPRLPLRVLGVYLVINSISALLHI